jgi:hypothetical protein
MDITPTILSSSHFAALAPTWAGIKNEHQLRGLFILGTLFNKKIYVYDTQIADNPHLLNSYKLRADKLNNLYNLLVDLIREDVVRVGIRDATYIFSKDKIFKCDTLSDVYASWIKQKMFKAWVTPHNAENRAELLAAVDKTLTDTRIQKYPYLSVKKDFMNQIREAFHGLRFAEYLSMLKKLPISVKEKYNEIIKRDWFSHSDIFQLLVNSGFTLQNSFVQIHGLFDEIAYANWNKIRLLGIDGSSLHGETILTGQNNLETPTAKEFESLSELIKQALRVLETPALSLIATLKTSEILELRAEASELFQLIDYMDTLEPLNNLKPFQDNYAEAIANYWEKICSFLYKTRPLLTRRRNKLGIFTREHLPTFSRWINKYTTFTINLGIDLLAKFLPSINKLNQKEKNALIENLSFRLVFFSDTEAMTQIKKIIPRKIWLSRNYTPIHPNESND